MELQRTVDSPDFLHNDERPLQLIDGEVLAALRQHGHDPLEQRRQILVSAAENNVQQEVEDGADLGHRRFGDADVVDGHFVALVDADVVLRRLLEQVGAELPDIVRGKAAAEQNGDLKDKFYITIAQQSDQIDSKQFKKSILSVADIFRRVA